METKRCSKCPVEKPVGEFGKYSRNPDGLSTYCKEHSRLMHRATYAEYPGRKERVKARSNKQARDNRVALREYLSAHPCVDCGEADIRVLEFDHRPHLGEKYKNVGTLMRGSYSWGRLEAEIAKCEVRCANCHRKRTSDERGWRLGL